MDFSKRYAKLNDSQRQAVDVIDGPVMVIAGPGTGKTELLSVRTANILKQTDTLPENILCLTFTDSGAVAMRKRLTEIIGKEAYKVAVHTFHSFGSEIINQNGQYFYQGAHFKPADQLSSYEIIRGIFEELEFSNPIASKQGDDYTHLSDSQTVISELKKAGLTSDELLRVLNDNNAVIEKTEQQLSPVFAEKISKKTAEKANQCIKAIRDSGTNWANPNVVPLSNIIADSLQSAVDEATESNSTKSITAWRNQWFKKDNNGKFILKSNERQKKLRALSVVYDSYLSRMEKAELYDFDDMILRVVHAMEVYDDLRFDLQEKYQYIMVDEFQDTNMAQMRILHNLTNNEVQGDTPNILVVGDDDQAIYSFQGANINNILDFEQHYPKVARITLTENYRSDAKILQGSRDIILQGNDRLENRIKDLNKNLNANNNCADSEVLLHEAKTITDERRWLVDDIQSRIKNGQKPSEIAVFTRRHHEISDLLPYFFDAGIAVNYERQDNVLENPLVILIEQLSLLLINLLNGRHDDVNAELPKVLAHPSWGFSPLSLWKLSIKAYDSHSRWLDAMSTTPEFMPLHSWLISTALQTKESPLEQILDVIVGKNDDPKVNQFDSPLFEFFFSTYKMKQNPDEYLSYLDALRTIRAKLREYRPDQIPTLPTFIDFIRLNRKIGSTISVIKQSIQSDDAINIMTAHKSKGLEFNTVYVVNAVDNVWGERARSRSRLINYPENLRLAPAGETDDERLRLFYVAITRAKKQLHISYSLSDDKGKGSLPAVFLVSSKWDKQLINEPETITDQIKISELDWYQPIISPITASMNELLMPSLENYKLSVTHLNNFLDVTRGGPANFLLNNLLHFPSAKSPSASYGTAIHDTLQQTHAYIAATGQKQAIEDIVSIFEKNLSEQHLTKMDFEKYLQKGSEALRIFLENKYEDFKSTQKPELNFANQNSIVEDAHLTGKLDVADIDKSAKIITVTDYKTGKAAKNWNGKDDFEKIKLHKYKQQLMFYKLLVENSRDYRGFVVEKGTMQFVEPNAFGEIISLDASFSNEDLAKFQQIIKAAWQHITTLNLPDVSGYEASYKGILAFEEDLINNSI